MRLYQSTRSTACVSDTEAVLLGIAPDGGLYLDPHLAEKPFDWKGCLEKDSLGIAAQLLSAFFPSYPQMEELVKKAYTGKFETPDLTPLVKVGGSYVLELFRGPTSAFKDVALSMLPQLITAAKALEGKQEKTLILTATSGDTGKAALAGFADVPGTEIIVFYPHGGVSPVQQAQMATQAGANVHVCAVRGNFDDCQSAVKAAFAAFGEEGSHYAKALDAAHTRLSSANSINIGRLAPQLSYYFIAYKKLLEEGRIALGDPVDFTVPTGNFGDILAGYFAKLLGLPVGRLILASNANRVLTDFMENGCYDRRRDFMKTNSPSMDILISSNLERLLFLAAEGDSAQVAKWMKELKEQGWYQLPEEVFARIRESFAAGCCDEQETLAEIRRVYEKDGYLCDTHTAVAMKVARELQRAEVPMVVLSTASPFKFPAAVLTAIGGKLEGDEFEQMEELSRESGLPIPAGLAGLKERPVLHREVIDREAIADYVLDIVRR